MKIVVKVDASQWLGSVNLRMCSPASRGFWVDLLCLMARSERVGYLCFKGNPMPYSLIAKATSNTLEEVESMMQELIKCKIALVRKGMVYSEDLIKQAEYVHKMKGCSAGNPKLKGKFHKDGYIYAVMRYSDNAIKIGITGNVDARVRSLNSTSLGGVELVHQVAVSSIGKHEIRIHKQLSSHHIEGEWFNITMAEAIKILNECRDLDNR